MIVGILMHGHVYCGQCEAGPEDCAMLVPLPGTMPQEEAKRVALAMFRNPRDWCSTTCPHCGADFHHLLPCNPTVMSVSADLFEYGL